MAKPRQADRVVEVAYVIAMAVNVIVSVCGYLMYGTGVSDEVCFPYL
jgi:vesicular inhibitory amino acid transporter